jgi:hypothetical protein
MTDLYVSIPSEDRGAALNRAALAIAKMEVNTGTAAHAVRAIGARIS